VILLASLIASLATAPSDWYGACRIADWPLAWEIASQGLAADSSDAAFLAAAAITGWRSGELTPEVSLELAEKAFEAGGASALAWVALGTGKVDLDPVGAVEAFTRSIGIDSLCAPGWEGLALALEGTGELALARADYARSMDADPLYAPAVLGFSRTASAEGDTSSALDALEAFVAISPASAPVFAEMAGLLAGLGLQDSAAVCYQHALEADSTDFATLQDYGLLLEGLGRWGEAVKIYRGMVELDPGYHWSYGELGYALESVSAIDSARVWYQRGLQVDPGYAWAALRLALLEQSEGNSREAGAWFETAAELDPAMPEIWVDYGLFEEEQGDLEAAASMYRSALDLDPADTWTWGELGYVLSQAGDSDGAAAAYESGILTDSSYAWGWEQRGLIYEGAGRVDEAIGWYRRAWAALRRLGLDASPWMLGELGMLLEQGGDPDSAVICYAGAVEIDSTYSFGTLRLGRLLGILGRVEEAEPLLLRYGVLSGDSASAYAELSRLWLASGSEGKSRILLERAYSISSAPLVSLGWSYFYTGHLEAASGAAHDALSSPSATTADLLDLATLFTSLDDSEGAQECYLRASEASPDDGEVWMAWGLSLSGNDEYSPAEQKFRVCVALDSTSVDGWNYLGEALLFQDRYDEARTALQRSLELDPQNVFAVCYLGLVEERRGNPSGALDSYLEALRMSPGYAYAEERIRSITDPDYDAGYWIEESHTVSASVWADASLEYGNREHRTYSGGADASWLYGPRGSAVRAELHGSFEKLGPRNLENTAWASLSADYFIDDAAYVKASTSWDRQQDTVRPWQISSYTSFGYKEWIRDWMWLSPEIGVGLVRSQWYLREKKTDDWTAFFSLGMWLEKPESLLPTFWLSAACYVPPDRPEEVIANGNAELGFDLWDRLSLSIGYTLDYTNRPVVSSWEKLDREIYTRLNLLVF